MKINKILKYLYIPFFFPSLISWSSNIHSFEESKTCLPLYTAASQELFLRECNKSAGTIDVLIKAQEEYMNVYKKPDNGPSQEPFFKRVYKLGPYLKNNSIKTYEDLSNCYTVYENLLNDFEHTSPYFKEIELPEKRKSLEVFTDCLSYVVFERINSFFQKPAPTQNLTDFLSLSKATGLLFTTSEFYKNHHFFVDSEPSILSGIALHILGILEHISQGKYKKKEFPLFKTQKEEYLSLLNTILSTRQNILEALLKRRKEERTDPYFTQISQLFLFLDETIFLERSRCLDQPSETTDVIIDSKTLKKKRKNALKRHNKKLKKQKQKIANTESFEKATHAMALTEIPEVSNINTTKDESEEKELQVKTLTSAYAISTIDEKKEKPEPETFPLLKEDENSLSSTDESLLSSVPFQEVKQEEAESNLDKKVSVLSVKPQTVLAKPSYKKTSRYDFSLQSQTKHKKSGLRRLISNARISQIISDSLKAVRLVVGSQHRKTLRDIFDSKLQGSKLTTDRTLSLLHAFNIKASLKNGKGSHNQLKVSFPGGETFCDTWAQHNGSLHPENIKKLKEALERNGITPEIVEESSTETEDSVN